MNLNDEFTRMLHHLESRDGVFCAVVRHGDDVAHGSRGSDWRGLLEPGVRVAMAARDKPGVWVASDGPTTADPGDTMATQDNLQIKLPGLHADLIVGVANARGRDLYLAALVEESHPVRKSLPRMFRRLLARCQGHAGRSEVLAEDARTTVQEVV